MFCFLNFSANIEESILKNNKKGKKNAFLMKNSGFTDLFAPKNRYFS